jgi:hypothetical protein
MFPLRVETIESTAIFRPTVMAALDPAIQNRIEMFRFFLDGHVKHGHDQGRVSPPFRFFHTLEGGDGYAANLRDING